MQSYSIGTKYSLSSLTRSIFSTLHPILFHSPARFVIIFLLNYLVLLLIFVSSTKLELSLLFHPTSSRKSEFATSLFELPRPIHTSILRSFFVSY